MQNVKNKMFGSYFYIMYMMLCILGKSEGCIAYRMLMPPVYSVLSFAKCVSTSFRL